MTGNSTSSQEVTLADVCECDLFEIKLIDPQKVEMSADPLVKEAYEYQICMSVLCDASGAVRESDPCFDTETGNPRVDLLVKFKRDLFLVTSIIPAVLLAYDFEKFHKKVNEAIVDELDSIARTFEHFKEQHCPLVEEE